MQAQNQLEYQSIEWLGIGQLVCKKYVQIDFMFAKCSVVNYIHINELLNRSIKSALLTAHLNLQNIRNIAI